MLMHVSLVECHFEALVKVSPKSLGASQPLPVEVFVGLQRLHPRATATGISVGKTLQE